jgi:ribulose kinase
MAKKYVIGIDYGTDSVRSVIVDTSNGKIVGTSVFETRDGRKGFIVSLLSTSSASTRWITSKDWNNQ